MVSHAQECEADLKRLAFGDLDEDVPELTEEEWAIILSFFYMHKIDNYVERDLALATVAKRWWLVYVVIVIEPRSQQVGSYHSDITRIFFSR